MGLLALRLLLFGLGVWFASPRAAVNEMTVARDSLVAARDAVGDSQPAQAKTFITAATESAEAASNRVNGPLWDVAAAVPGLGRHPAPAQAIATSLDQALTALRPLTDQLDVLDPSRADLRQRTDRRRGDPRRAAGDEGGRAWPERRGRHGGRCPRTGGCCPR